MVKFVLKLILYSSLVLLLGEIRIGQKKLAEIHREGIMSALSWSREEIVKAKMFSSFFQLEKISSIIDKPTNEDDLKKKIKPKNQKVKKRPPLTTSIDEFQDSEKKSLLELMD